MTQHVAPLFAVSIASSVLFTIGGSAADWPHWRGPARTGISAESLPVDHPALDVVWETEIGRGYSAIAVADDRAYTMGHDGTEHETVYCLDAATGAEIWKHSYPAELIPTAHPGGPNAMPTIDGDRLYTVSKDGQLLCFTAADGEVRWIKNLPEDVGFELPTWGVASAPLIDGDQLILSAAYAFALDKHTGDMLWKSTLEPKGGYATPTRFEANGQALLACLFGKSVSLINASNGERLASAPIEAEYDVTAATPVIIDPGTVRFFVSANKTGRMLRYDQGELLTEWETTDMRTSMNTCLLLDGHLYGFSGKRGRADTSLTCIRASDGSVAWAEPGMGAGSLVAAGSRLLALTEDGEVVVAEATADGFKPIARKQILEKTCWTPPSLVDGKLFIRNDRGRVACVDLGG